MSSLASPVAVASVDTAGRIYQGHRSPSPMAARQVVLAQTCGKVVVPSKSWHRDCTSTRCTPMNRYPLGSVHFFTKVEHVSHEQNFANLLSHTPPTDSRFGVGRHAGLKKNKFRQTNSCPVGDRWVLPRLFATETDIDEGYIRSSQCGLDRRATGWDRNERSNTSLSG